MSWPGNTDKMRGLFLKGFKLSTQGNYEDPTYLGFKIIVDFGNGGIDPEFGTPTSPLFKGSAYTDDQFVALNPFGQEQYSVKGNGGVYFHSAQSYLQEREEAFGDTNKNKRADAIAQFAIGFRNLLEDYPWFIQSIDGLDELTKVKRGGYVNDGSSDFDPSRTNGKTLTFNCLESLNLRMLALSELYKQATFDPDYMRDLVPRNLRKFRMYIFVTEIRNFFKTSRLIANSATLATLNNTANLLSNAISSSSSEDPSSTFDSGGGFGSNTGKLGKLASNLGVDDITSTFRDQSDQSGIKPVLVIRCDDCEFNFDDSTSIPSKIDNGSESANQATFSFKVNVQRVRTKYQFPNIRTDGKFLILKDGWDQNGSSLQKLSNNNPLNRLAEGDIGGFLAQAGANAGLGDAATNLLEGAGDALTNVVSGAVNDMINEGIADFITPALRGLDQTLLGNVYNSQSGQRSGVGGAIFNSAQRLLDDNGLGNITNIIGSNSPSNPFSGNLPNSQTLGFGGPPERVYSSPGGNTDLYGRVPGQDLGVNTDSSISRVYPEVSAGDAYNDVPGSALGVPDRVYPQPNGDFYVEVPGADLGVPGRVYPPPSGVTDAYSGVPGQDLGVPDRVYPAPDGDAYPTVAGPDLGVPDRVYPEPEGDVYPTVAGPDLGVPDRVYPQPQGDVYPTVAGPDLGVPDRVYSGPNDDAYSNVPGQDLGVPDRNYPSFNDRVYPDPEPFANNNFSDRVYAENSASPTQAFSDRVYADPQNPEISYQINNRPESSPEPIYPKISAPQISRGELGKSYPKTAEDFVIEKAIEQTTLDLGNMKPESKYNASLGQFNPDENKFED